MLDQLMAESHTSHKEKSDIEHHALTELLPENVAVYSLPENIRGTVDTLDLPFGYGLIGGAARAVASNALQGEHLPVRDIDVGAFTDYDPDPAYARDIAERLMPDDYAHGHGVSFDSLEDYFASRDFTMNEVAVIEDSLLISRQAEHDLRLGIIRPTLHEHDPENDWHLSSKLAVKAVLQQAVFEQNGYSAKIEGVDLDGYVCDITDGDEEMSVRPFWVALGFQKALEHGEDVAHAFLDKLFDYGMIRADSLQHTDDTRRLADFAEELEQASDFEIRGDAQKTLATLRHLASQNCSLGDLLYAVGGDDFDQYVQYHEMAQRYGGKGRQFVDEAKY